VSARENTIAPTVAFPLKLRPDGVTDTVTDRRTAVEQLIEELLFTNPGERLNRPTLGCGLLETVFGPLESELMTATQFQVKSELQTWLGDLLTVVAVDVTSSGSTMAIAVSYQLPDVAGVTTVTFER
jgi:phage baseplate assembly protein W